MIATNGNGVVRIYLRLPPRTHKNRSPGYDVALGSPSGPVVVRDSSHPSMDAARVLLAKGITGRLELWRSGRTNYDFAGDIEELARLVVRESASRGPEFALYRESPFPKKRRSTIGGAAGSPEEANSPPPPHGGDA